MRPLPLAERRVRLEQVITDACDARMVLSPVIAADTWEALSETWLTSRANNVEGIMLKRHTSPYRVGRQRGDSWKWKVRPFTVDAVLIYAQPGSGKRASLLTDYTFGLWDAGRLVPVAKAYSGLTVGINNIAAGSYSGATVEVSNIAAASAQSVADHVLNRAIATGADGGRNVQDALRALRNRVDIGDSIGTVYTEDDVTSAWTFSIATTANAVFLTGINPAGGSA